MHGQLTLAVNQHIGALAVCAQQNGILVNVLLRQARQPVLGLEELATALALDT
jgi:hypothetical protein